VYRVFPTLRAEKRRSTSQRLDAPTLLMLPSALSFASSTSSQAGSTKRCRQTSLAGDHCGHTRRLLHGARNRFLAHARQAWCRSVANPTTTTDTTSRPQLYILSVGCTVETQQAEPRHHELPSARRPPIQSDIATIAGHARPSPKRESTENPRDHGKPRPVRLQQVARFRGEHLSTVAPR
jgi:hypothetical protein